jgi:hypothetical protein
MISVPIHKPGDFIVSRDIEALIGSSPTGINQVFVVAIFENRPVNCPTITIWDNDTSYSRVCGEFMKYQRKNLTITNRNSSMSSPKYLYPNSPGYGDVDYQRDRMSQRCSSCSKEIVRNSSRRRDQHLHKPAIFCLHPMNLRSPY